MSTEELCKSGGRKRRKERNDRREVKTNEAGETQEKERKAGICLCYDTCCNHKRRSLVVAMLDSTS